jgi:hypothetical protein
MKKLFWFLYSRIRLWYLYRGCKIPYSERQADYKCPVCFWDTSCVDYPDESCLGVSNHTYGYDGAEYWTEHWKCPRCGTKFDTEDSN